eukprot:7320863-Alexandrium_andersonii.AAC.2
MSWRRRRRQRCWIGRRHRCQTPAEKQGRRRRPGRGRPPVLQPGRQFWRGRRGRARPLCPS